MTTMEEEFGLLLEHMRADGRTNLQRDLKTLQLEEVPEQFRRSFGFWQSLSGPSRNLLYDVACGRRTKKVVPSGGRKRRGLKTGGNWPRMPRIP